MHEHTGTVWFYLYLRSIFMPSWRPEKVDCSQWADCTGCQVSGICSYWLSCLLNLKSSRRWFSDGSNHQALKLTAKVIFLAGQRCSCFQCPRQDLKEPCLSPHCQGWGSAPPLHHTSAFNNLPQKCPLAQWMLNNSSFSPRDSTQRTFFIRTSLRIKEQNLGFIRTMKALDNVGIMVVFIYNFILIWLSLEFKFFWKVPNLSFTELSHHLS